ncbi:MAG: CGGC domain-containing protein [Thermodesulfobacteriota bacterium]
MAKIAILSCKKIKDITCVSCIKCFKAMQAREGEFARYKDEELDIVAMGDCGDCPGLVMPKLALISDVAKQYGREFDTVHLGTCIVKATSTAACPINIDRLKEMIEKKMNKKVVVGTHNY